MPARILLADDHALVLEGIKKLLDQDYELVGEVREGRELLDKIQECQPDVALVDISLPLLNGIDAVSKIRKIAPKVKIIFLTMHAEQNFVEKAREVGASGYVLKQSAVKELKHAIEEALAGRTFITPGISQEPAQETRGSVLAAPPPNRLTPRQREIIQLVAEGLSNKEIAQTLHLSIKTVEFHKTRIMEELDLRSVPELTKYAVAHGLVAL